MPSSACVLFLSALLCAPQPAAAQYIEQGTKLLGTSVVGNAQQGISVALSADGNTAIMGGDHDNSSAGAAWVFIRSGGVWTQQGAKLVGSGAVGAAQQGFSVALSADGNTAIVGGNTDNSQAGAAWVYTRSAGLWHQQAKLIGTGGVNAPQLGAAVALSADGNTAVVGGYFDNSGAGAVWVFTRSAGLWSQQGARLVGSNAAGAAPFQGVSVAVSADGNTLIEGGYLDNSGVGAAWVFTRSGGVWTQQGSKLVGTGAAGAAKQGTAVSLSADGNTAIVGGYSDNGNAGAAWIYTRSGGVWTQHGDPLYGAGAIGPAYLGVSAALSADGNTAVVGGYQDNSGIGAAWVFRYGFGFLRQYGPKLVGGGAVGGSRQGISVAVSGDSRTVMVGGYQDNSNVGAAWVFASHAAHDFNVDYKSDILWRDTSGNVALWQMNSGQVVSSTLISKVPTSWSIVGQRDFNGDGESDILWRDNTGNVALWLMNGATVSSSTFIANVPTSWTIAGTGDFDGDGKADILWRDNTGNVAIWLMNGATVTSSLFVANVPNSWSIVGASGKDIFWRDNVGNTAWWMMNGGTVTANVYLGNVPTTWSIVGVGDLDGDGDNDILWRDSSGNTAIWFLSSPSGSIEGSTVIGNVPTTWSVAETGDFNGDGTTDILWHNNTGNVALWLMKDAAVLSNLFVSNVPTVWTIQGAGAD